MTTPQLEIKYGLVQFLPDLSSGEAFNWALLVLVPIDDEQCQVVCVYDSDGNRIRAAVPWYRAEHHERACRRLEQFIKSLESRAIRQERIWHALNRVLPLGYRVGYTGVERATPDRIDALLKDLYEYYITRSHPSYV